MGRRVGGSWRGGRSRYGIPNAAKLVAPLVGALAFVATGSAAGGER